VKKKKATAQKRAPVKKLTRAQRYLQARKQGRTVPATGPAGELQQLAARADGWANVYTALGISNRDKRTGVVQCPTILDFRSLEDLYRGDDMAARIVDLFPEEMLRRGFSVYIPNEDDQSDQLNMRFDELETEDHFLRAMKWARAYGGAGIFIGANDGKKADKPLDEDAVTSVDWLTVFDCQELRPVQWYTDPGAKNFSLPEIYGVYPKIAFTGTNMNISKFNQAYAQGLFAPTKFIHESRIIPFRGIEVSRVQSREMLSWGDSVLIRCYEVLQDFSGGFGSTANLLQDFAQAVIKLEGLAEIVSGNDTDVVRARAEAIDIGRSTLRAMLLDSKDDFSRSQTPVTGLAEILEKFMLRLAAAAGYPVTLLFGQAPAGLQATGESDIRWFYDKVAAQQKKMLRPALRKLTRLLFKDQGIEQPGEWDIRFPTPWQLSDLEEAKRRLMVAQTDQIYILGQVVKPAEVGVARFSGAKFDPELTIEETDVAAREKAMPEVVMPGSGTVKPETEPHKTNVGKIGAGGTATDPGST
jgi:phage-related protein (TIGR01555 family)